MEGEQGEAIMICVDTSSWIAGNKNMLDDQLAAVRAYCTHKLKSHEDTVVGLCGMADNSRCTIVEPGRSVTQITNPLYRGVAMGGYLSLCDSIEIAHFTWFGCRRKELGVHLPKRIVVFAGGPLCHDKIDPVIALGKAMKKRNVACDAIIFGSPRRNKEQIFETFISAADNNDNCHLLNVQPDSSLLETLLRTPFIKSHSTPFVETSETVERYIVIPHVGGSGPVVTSVNQENPKRDPKAAANHPEDNPHDHQLRILDPKLENVKPNSQPETLDQRIEMLEREIESLKMQKKKQVAC